MNEEQARLAYASAQEDTQTCLEELRHALSLRNVARVKQCTAWYQEALIHEQDAALELQKHRTPTGQGHRTG